MCTERKTFKDAQFSRLYNKNNKHSKTVKKKILQLTKVTINKGVDNKRCYVHVLCSCYVHVLEDYRAMKRNGVELFRSSWVNLKSRGLNENSKWQDSTSSS